MSIHLSFLISFTVSHFPSNQRHFQQKAGCRNEEELSRLGEITKKEFDWRPGILIREEYLHYIIIPLGQVWIVKYYRNHVAINNPEKPPIVREQKHTFQANWNISVYTLLPMILTRIRAQKGFIKCKGEAAAIQFEYGEALQRSLTPWPFIRVFIPFLKEKVPLSYPFYWQMVPPSQA